MITLEEKNRSKPLYFQIYLHIKREIHEGRLKAGERLYSKRKLAESLGVSVNTVETAYSQLLSEGFIEARPKSGYYVCQIDELNFVRNAGKRGLAKGGEDKTETDIIDFSTDGVDWERFPYNTWIKLIKGCFNEYNPGILKSPPPEGDYELRKAVAGHIYRYRGVSCSAGQIIIGAGMDNLLNIICGLLGREYSVIMEEPVYRESYSVFKYNGHRVGLIPVDGEGLMTDRRPSVGKAAVYITPSHQFPLGMTMSAARRVKLLNWASAAEGRYIIEDDYDSEFRYNSKPIPAVQSIDGNGRVIYLGTFSKTIAPSVRISYMALPPGLMDEYNRRFTKFSTSVSALEQEVIAAFINGGHYERHLNRMRKLYGEKRAVLLEELGKLGDAISINGENAGHHLALRLKNGPGEEKMTELAAENGVRVYPISPYFINGTPENYENTVLIGYASLPKERITEGVERLRRAWGI